MKWFNLTGHLGTHYPYCMGNPTILWVIKDTVYIGCGMNMTFEHKQQDIQ